MMEVDETISAVRRFNRFYTRAIGVLDRAFLGGPYTLAESRVLYEIAEGEDLTASDIAAALDLDAGYLSRMISRLRRDGLITRQPSPRDGRSAELRLTDAGSAYFATLNARMAGQIEELIGGLSAVHRQQLTGSLQMVQTLLEASPEPEAVTLRAHRPGDMGWVVERHAEIYGQEYGWGPKIEAVTARIVADFLTTFDPALDRCWIAERGETRLGCVFLVREPDAPGVARLRLLLLDPQARGLGLGRRLVASCVAFARAAGYREVVLWTHAVLTAARGLYADAGFTLEETWTHDDLGAPEVSETWRLIC